MTVFAMVALASTMVEQGEAFKCGTKQQDRAKDICGPFQKGKKPEPSAECCKVLKEIRETVKTREERKELCHCVQDSVKSYKFDETILIKNIDALPKKCGIPYLFSADKKFDCNS